MEAERRYNDMSDIMIDTDMNSAIAITDTAIQKEFTNDEYRPEDTNVRDHVKLLANKTQNVNSVTDIRKNPSVVAQIL